MEDIQVIIHDSSDDNESGRLVQPPQNSPLPTSPFRQSRTIANRMMEHKISQEKKEDENKWSSCCSSRKTDKRLLRFFSSLTISVMTLGFSIYQLSTVEKRADKEIYVGLLTLVLGWWTPSPI